MRPKKSFHIQVQATEKDGTRCVTSKICARPLEARHNKIQLRYPLISLSLALIQRGCFASIARSLPPSTPEPGSDKTARPLIERLNDF